ncbi:MULTISPECIES: DUF559 domain-containing protein [unclassified Rathayibacter]|uniref:DUF559 domain-containing protein n=1 Tax=unclassified Rathayibacter TaxID=2609250 RepID=UPI001405546A|nr:MULTISPECIES: DUF559 domain-containing protein [unclassified Rathayibacter]
MTDIDLGAFTRRAALREGATDGELRSPRLASPFHGVRTRVMPVTHVERALAYRPRLRPGQFFSHLTAAELWSVPLPFRRPEDDPIHVATFSPRRPPRTRGVVGHVLLPQNVAVSTRFGLPVADAASTWVSLGMLLPDRDLLAAADHLLLVPRYPDEVDPRPYAGLSDLQDRVNGYHGPGRRRLESVLRLVSTAAASCRETALRSLVREAGLPAPEVNVEITVGGRLIAIGDLVFRRWKVLAEYDGRQHQTNDAQYARDRERSLALQLAGWIQVVVRADGLERDRARTVAEIRAALMAHGWRP